MIIYSLLSIQSIPRLQNTLWARVDNRYFFCHSYFSFLNHLLLVPVAFFLSQTALTKCTRRSSISNHATDHKLFVTQQCAPRSVPAEPARDSAEIILQCVLTFLFGSCLKSLGLTPTDWKLFSIHVTFELSGSFVESRPVRRGAAAVRLTLKNRSSPVDTYPA